MVRHDYQPSEWYVRQCQENYHFAETVIESRRNLGDNLQRVISCYSYCYFNVKGVSLIYLVILYKPLENFTSI